MNTKHYTLQECEKLTGIPRATLRRWLESGKIEGRLTKKGQRSTWEIEASVLRNLTPPTEHQSYSKLVDQWVAEMKSGYHTGKHLSPNTIRNYRSGLASYWEILELSPTFNDLSPENLRLCFSKVPIDDEKKVCHFALKQQMFKGICSFYKMLIRHNLKTETELFHIQKNKPKRVYPAIKPVLTESEVLDLLEKNENWKTGRTDSDRKLMRILIALYFWSGIRRNEGLDLTLKDISFEKRQVQVIDGKGHKNRLVPMLPELEVELRQWIQKDRPTTDHPHLLIQENGLPVTESVVNHRFVYMSRSFKTHITPHALRRACGTTLENKGMPMSMVQMFLGHSDIKTTQGYILTEQKQMLSWLEQYYAPKHSPDTPQNTPLSNPNPQSPSVAITHPAVEIVRELERLDEKLF